MAWNPTLVLNPEFVRGVRTTLPRRRALFVAGLTLSLLAAGAWVLWNNSEPSAYSVSLEEPEREAKLRALQVSSFGGTAFTILTTALFALLFMLGPAMTTLSFVLERLRGTAVFQQMTLLSPFRLAAGKFWGAGAFAYFVALMLLPCALAAAWLGGMSAPVVARLYLFLFVGGFAWQAVGLCASAALSGPSERALRGGLLVGPLVAVGGAVLALALCWFFLADYEEMARWLAEVRPVQEGDEYLYERYQFFWWHFYGVRLPAYAVVLGLLGFAGLWAFAGAVRRIKAWQLIPLSPRTAWLFFVSAGAVLVGLLWGRHPDDTPPIDRLQVYMLLAWGAVAALAGGSALTRGRLREWWSAERDPLALLQRSEIKGSAATLLVAFGVSLAGLLALWLSYHANPLGRQARYNLLSQFLPIAAGFGLTLLATTAFVQFCAMFRFRIGGWAGVALLVVVYAFAGVAGVMFDDKEGNAAALLNPLAYAGTITRGDYFMDSRYESNPLAPYEVELRRDAGSYRGERVVLPTHYDTRGQRGYWTAAITVRGFGVEAVFAFLCLAFAYLKWTRTREEMLADSDV